MQIRKNQKLIRNLVDGHGQKCVWIVWSWGSKIDCVLEEQMEYNQTCTRRPLLGLLKSGLYGQVIVR